MTFKLPPAFCSCPAPGCERVWLIPIYGELCETHGFHVSVDWDDPTCAPIHTDFAAHLRDAHGDEEKALDIEKITINQGAANGGPVGPFDQDG